MSHRMEPKNRDVALSKALAYLLRHGAMKEKLPIDSNGYIPVDTLLKHQRLKSLRATVQDIQRVVDSNDKKRFHLKLDPETQQSLVCATQGHSLREITPSEEVLVPIVRLDDLPAKLVHGTNVKNCILILQSGCLKKMNRNHVHLSPGITGKDTEVVSGMRYSSNVYIYIKRTQETLDTLQIFKSLNNVYLCSQDIPTSCVQSIEIRSSKTTETNPQLQQLQALAHAKNISVSLI